MNFTNQTGSPREGKLEQKSKEAQEHDVSRLCPWLTVLSFLASDLELFHLLRSGKLLSVYPLLLIFLTCRPRLPQVDALCYSLNETPSGKLQSFIVLLLDWCNFTH